MGKVYLNSVQVGTFSPQTIGTTGDVQLNTTDVGDFTLGYAGNVLLNSAVVGTYYAAKTASAAPYKIIIDSTPIGVLKQIEQTLDSHEEAIIILPNTADNRERVSTDKDIYIEYESQTIFMGILKGASYDKMKGTLICPIYQKAYEKMECVLFTNTYDNVAASTILQDIATAAGVTYGLAPSTLVSVRFDKATCLDAFRFLADACNEDCWADGTTVYIGSKGTNKGTIVPIDVSRRSIDRAKVRDKVWVRGVDVDGNTIWGSAGTGNREIVFTEKKASDVSTLNFIAAKKLKELEKQSSGVSIRVDPIVGNFLYTGDDITLDDPELELSGSYEILKIIKRQEITIVEADKPELVLKDIIDAYRKYEDLGIYPLSEEQATMMRDFTFTLYKVGTEYRARDLNGYIKYSGTDAKTVINNAIADATCKTMLLLPYLFDCDGTITFKNDFHIHLSEGAEIRAVTNLMDRLIDARDMYRINITGTGSINGQDRAKKVVDMAYTSGVVSDIIIRDVRINGGRDVTDSCLLDITYHSETMIDGAFLDGIDTGAIHYCIIMDNSDGGNRIRPQRISRWSKAGIRQGGGELNVHESSFVTPRPDATACVEIKPNGQTTETKFHACWFEGVKGPGAGENCPVAIVQEGVGAAAGYPRVLLFDSCFLLADNKECVKSNTTSRHLRNLMIIGGVLSTTASYSVDCTVLEKAVLKPHWANAKYNLDKLLGIRDVGLTGGNQNLVRNPSYEFGDWGGAETQVSTQAKYGNYSAELIASGSTVASGWSSYMLVKNLPYFTITACMKVTSYTQGNFVAIVEFYNIGKTPLGTSQIGSPSSGTHDWETRRKTFGITGETGQEVEQVPSGTAYARVRFYWDGTPTGTGYCDGWQLIFGWDAIPPFEDHTFPLTAAQATAPTEPTTGDLWFDTTNNQLKRYSGTTWQVVHHLSTHGASDPVSGMTVGDFFYNTTDGYLKRYDGTNWIKVMHQEYGASFPGSPEVGDTYYHTGYEQTFYWNGSNWIPLATIARQGTESQMQAADAAAGDIWYATDTELFYRYNGTSWIRVSLLGRAALPAENYLWNSDFEEDRDGDNVPDGWRVSSQKGDGAAVRVVTDQDKGGACMKLSASNGGTSNGVAVGAKDLLRVQASEKYFASCRCKGSGENPHLVIEWRDKDKNALTPVEDVTGTISAGWLTYSKEMTSHASAKYASVFFQVWEPGANATLYYDDIIFSKVRAISPTPEVVGGNVDYATGITTITGPMSKQHDMTAVSVDTEVFYVWVKIIEPSWTNGTSDVVYAQVRDVTEGQNSPIAYIQVFNTGSSSVYVGLVALPWNVNNHDLDLWLGTSSGSSVTVTNVRYYQWGHSPHRHQ